MSLQLKTRIQNVNIIDPNIELRKFIFNTMLVIFAALALGYVLILGNTVFNITERRALEKESLALLSEVGELELTYLALSSGVDAELSEAMGFRETPASFATRKSLGYGPEGTGTLRFTGNEI